MYIFTQFRRQSHMHYSKKVRWVSLGAAVFGEECAIECVCMCVFLCEWNPPASASEQKATAQHTAGAQESRIRDGHS